MSSYLEKLLDGAGVEWLPLEQVAKIKHGKDWKGMNTGVVPVYGSGGIMGYVDTYSYEKPTVLIPRKGSITNIFYLEAPFWNVDTIYYTEIDTSKIVPKYFYHFIKTIDLVALDTGSGRPSLTQAILNKLNVPIPCPENPKKSLAIQSEIVRILDSFTELTAELTAELTMRKKQYNYYRQRLLSFDEGEVAWKTLGEVVQLQRGKRLVKKQLEESGTYAVYQNSMTPLGYYHKSNVTADTTFIICAGAAGEIGYKDDAFWAADDVYVCKHSDDIISKFLYHCLLNQKDKILSQVRRASIPRLSKVAIDKLVISVPSIKQQARIVSILDKFEALTNSLQEGLPREIELRKKQYEYYRDELLNFPKVNKATV
jgi:type I restriction enzyme, S subunit